MASSVGREGPSGAARSAWASLTAPLTWRSVASSVPAATGVNARIGLLPADTACRARGSPAERAQAQRFVLETHQSRDFCPLRTDRGNRAETLQSFGAPGGRAARPAALGDAWVITAADVPGSATEAAGSHFVAKTTSAGSVRAHCQSQWMSCGIQNSIVQPSF